MLINDRHIGVIKFGHEEREIETTCAYYPSECLKTRCGVVTFPAGNHGLSFAEARTQFGLSQSGSQSSLFD